MKIKRLEREQLDIKSVNVGNFKLMGSVITNSVDSRTAVVAAGGRIQRNHVKERAQVTRETNPTLRKRKVAQRNKYRVLESQGGQGIRDIVRGNQDLVTHLSGSRSGRELPVPGDGFAEIRVTKEANGPRLVECLKGYDPQSVKFFREGFSQGFRLQYKGSRVYSVGPNLKTALERPEALEAKLSKELGAGRIVGPFAQCPLPNLRCSPVGLQPKKDGTFRMIHHLSWPHGDSGQLWHSLGVHISTVPHSGFGYKENKGSGEALFFSKNRHKI